MSVLKYGIATLLYALPIPVLAVSLTDTIKNPLTPSGKALTDGKALGPGGGPLYARFAVMMTSLTGAIFLVMVIYAGFLMLTSQGKEDQIEKGKNILIWCAVGIIVIASAYVIVQFYLNAANSTGLVKGQQ